MKFKMPTMPTTKKGKVILAAKIVGVLLGARLLLGGGAVAIKRFIGQAYGPDGLPTPWRRKPLGLSSTATIGESGCMLCSLNTAYNALTGEDLNPDAVQDLIIGAGGGFMGEELILEVAASSLGLVAPDSMRIHPRTGHSKAELAAAMDDALSQKGLALVHVDASASGAGQHFILCHGKSGGSYLCADPATASDTLIGVDDLIGVAMWGSTPRTYNVVGVAPVFST